MRVRVAILGVTASGGQFNQSQNLLREADEVIILDKAFLDDVFTGIESPEALPDTTSTQSPASVAVEFATEWLVSATTLQVEKLWTRRPTIPWDIDVKLIEAAKTANIETVNQGEVRSLRAAFWKAIGLAATTEEE